MSKDLFDLPEGWSWQPLSALAEIVSGGTPSREVAEYWSPAEIAWVTPTDITGSDGRHLTSSKERISKAGLQKSSAAMLPVGTVLMTSRATLGQAKISAVECCTNQGFKSLVPKTGVPSEYLYYLVQLFKTRYEQLGIGSTFLEVSKKDTEKFMLPVAPEGQRISIAKILGCVDNQIDATQALIDKCTAIKQGMMADLFSRGIDPETKALRPTFEEAPELYHKTPLGMLPKGWDVKTLGNAINGSGFIQTGPFGSQLHAYDYVDSGIPVVMPQDIVQGRISIEKIAYITETKASSLSRHKLKLNDVIFSRRGDLTRSSFVDVQNGYEGFLCGTGCLLMRVDASNIVGGWFSYMYSSDLVQRQVEGLAVGTTMPNLNGSILKKLIIPFPSVEEQTHIFSKIAAAQSLIDENAKHLGKLVAQKSGLMQDLLTGKVPVPA
ncbi:restriction endonuclease subunit S [Vibrio vulnificus]|nr:restriction endonuclease subunit S [Vibrio vulnificus]EIO4059411.1 restriction endonuclease subunit S [Vibrio vulnificus]